jgi:cobalt-zinc-cadmium efflux system protein
MLMTGWAWIDPLAAILVSVVIAFAAFGLLRSSFSLALDAVPASVDRQAVAEWLETRPGVKAVHDLHIWSLSTTAVAMTAHLVMPGGHPGDASLDQLADELNDRFGIAHATLQVEIGDSAECRLAPANVV